MENFKYYLGIFLLSIILHFIIYLYSVSNVTYLQYKYRYKRMFIDWTLLFFIFIILPYIIYLNSYK